MRFVKKIMGINDVENDINRTNEEIEDYESSSSDNIEIIHGEGGSGIEEKNSDVEENNGGSGEESGKSNNRDSEENSESEISGAEEENIESKKDNTHKEKNESSEEHTNETKKEEKSSKQEEIEDIIYEEIGYERKGSDWEEIGVFTLDEGIYGCTFILSSSFAVETDRFYARMFFETPNYEKTPKVKTIFNGKEIHYDRPTETFFKLVLLKKSVFTVQLKMVREIKHNTDPFKGVFTIYICPI